MRSGSCTKGIAPLKIVYCLAGTFNSGGMERVLANKANQLVQMGHQLIIVTTDQAGEKPYFELDDRIEQIDLSINYSSVKGLLRKLLLYPFKQRLHKARLQELLLRVQADVVISMFDHEATLLSKLKDGSKKVLEIHFSRYKRIQYGRKGLWRIIDQYRSWQDLVLAQSYDRFVVLTREDQTYWGDLPNIMVIPNANTFSPAEPATLDNKRVIAVGRYDAQKAFDELILAWVKVYDRHPDWSLKLFGQGPLRPLLQKIITDNGLEQVVQLCDPVHDLAPEYLSSAMLVMSSRYEGLPMAMLEAQACGLPLVAYACKCGPRDLIQEGRNGYLIASGNRDALAEKVNFLIENPQLRKQMGASSRVLSYNFSPDVVMQQWLTLFEELRCQRKQL
jgi:glycosyltransferase involved in cell wall biosynthesis